MQIFFLLFTIFFSFSHEESIALSAVELEAKQVKIIEQLNQIELAILNMSETDFIKAISGSTCNGHCEAQTLNWRHSLLEFIKNLKIKLPELMRTNLKRVREILSTIWDISVHSDAAMLKERFVTTSLSLIETSRQLSHRGSAFAAKSVGRYNKATATVLVTTVATTYLPWTIATEVLESSVMGVLHVFCHASQVVYFAGVYALADTLDRSLKYISYRPNEFTASKKIAFSLRMQRLFSAMKKQVIQPISPWQVPQDLAQARSIYLAYEKEYALIAELRLFEAIRGEISWRQHMQYQYMYQSHLRYLIEGIELVSMEQLHKGQLEIADKKYLHEVFDQGVQKMKRVRYSPGAGKCIKLFAS